MLVTVVIPSYNSARTLRLCLRSVADQTYQPIETIVVDDGSTDGSASIAAELGATLVRTPANAGPATARNLGAIHARGEILFFLDADIALDPGSVAAAVAELEADPGLGAICGVLDPQPLLPTRLSARYRAAQQFAWFDEADGQIPGLHTAMCGIRTNIFVQVGPFDPALRYTEDQEYGYRLRRRYQVRATHAIHGRHDHRDSLARILRKVYHRTRLGMPLWLANRSLPGGAATGSRALASVAVLAAVLATMLAVPLGLGAAAAVPILLAIAIALDLPTYRHVFASRTLAFGLYFVIVHLTVNLTTAVAASIGVVRALSRA
jgi:GT2 family glycosyltransferase